MTIKEIQKTYKKIDKLFSMANEAYQTITKQGYLYSLSDLTTFAANIVKANRGLEKLASAMHCTVEDMINHPDIESFARWVFLNNIELHYEISTDDSEEI